MTAVCAECETVADCKLAFGIYWKAKSGNGTGCRYPFPGWPKGWRKPKSEMKQSAAVTPGARRGRCKLVWQGEF